MKLWRWFVGQVARLRRSVVGVLASGSQPLHADDRLTFGDEPPGPPAHWVERVRQGAPGLLQPSFRRRDGPAEPPPAERVALSQPELEPEPKSVEQPEHGSVRTGPTVAPERPEAPVRVPLERKARGRRLRRALRRMPSRAPVEVAPAIEPGHVSNELERRVSNPGHSPTPEPDRRRFAGEKRRTPAPPQSLADEHSQGPPVPDKTVGFQAPPEPDKPEQAKAPVAERSPARSEVVAFEAPVLRRTAGLERAANPAPPLEAGPVRPSTKDVAPAELALDETRHERVWGRSVPSSAPRRTAEPRLEPVLTPMESSVDRSSPPRRHAEPLSEAGAHPWPELPPPLDQPDSDVEAALRAWEHQRRLDDEQTRL